MTRRRARRVRRKANAWARKARRSVLHRGESKRRICTTAELRKQARTWPWPRNMWKHARTWLRRAGWEVVW